MKINVTSKYLKMNLWWLVRLRMLNKTALKIKIAQRFLAPCPYLEIKDALVSKSKKFLLQMSLFQYKTKKNKYIIPCSIFSITHSVFIFKYSYSIDCIFKYISQNRVLNYRAPMKQSPSQLQHNQWINNISKIQSTVNQLNFFGVKLIFKQTDILHGYLIDWILVWQNDVSVNLHWKQF